MYEMSQVLGTDLNPISDNITIDDVDDDFGSISFDLNDAVTPELPHRDFTIRTLTPEKLESLRKSSN